MLGTKVGEPNTLFEGQVDKVVLSYNPPPNTSVCYCVTVLGLDSGASLVVSSSTSDSLQAPTDNLFGQPEILDTLGQISKKCISGNALDKV